MKQQVVNQWRFFVCAAGMRYIRFFIPAVSGACMVVVALFLMHTRQVFADEGREVISFVDNGGWCWYQDERVVVHNGKFILASLADNAGTDGRSRGGNVEVTTYDIASGEKERVVLEKIFQGDDHNNAALLVRPDNRYLAVYAGHGDDRLMRWMVSDSDDATRWGTRQRLDVGDNNTYSNLFRLSAENNGKGRVYNFHRGRGYNPNCMISDDEGDSWTYGGRLLEGKGRPYVKYASNSVDVIHFTNTEQHPRDYDNSIYHGYIKDGRIYDSYGEVIDDNLFDTHGPAPDAPTRVYKGGPDHVAWTSDLQLDTSGNPYMVFSVQMNSAGLPTGRGGEDHRYHYAYLNGSMWHEYEIAYAGSRLYSGEDDYTGNIALDPNNLNVVVISTNVDPENGNPLRSSEDNRRHYELYKGVTIDSGKNWEWTPVTSNSTVDNIRPVIPVWDEDNTVLFWMRGTYSSYTEYATEIVGTILDEPVHTISHAGTALQRGKTVMVSLPGNRMLHLQTDFIPDHISLFDMSGRLVWKTPYEFRTKVSVLRPDGISSVRGMYLLRLSGGGNAQTEKVCLF